MIGMVVFFGRVGNLCSDVKEVEHKPIKMVLIEVFFFWFTIHQQDDQAANAEDVILSLIPEL